MAHIKRINYREVHVFMYLIKYAHMAHIKRINYRELTYWLYNKAKHQEPMEKASREGRFTLISRGCVVFEKLFSGPFWVFLERKKKALSELQQRKTSGKSSRKKVLAKSCLVHLL